jgi:hypothetical protein
MARNDSPDDQRSGWQGLAVLRNPGAPSKPGPSTGVAEYRQPLPPDGVIPFVAISCEVI